MSKTGNLIYPVFLPMQGCPRRCIYCDQHKISAAKHLDPLQHLSAAAAFIQRNAGRTKEIAFYGGSFTALSPAYRQQLLTAYAQIIDADTSFRISTHPLYISEPILQQCREQGIKCIELGIQDFSTAVLNASGRGYDSIRAREAALMVKAAGFKLGIQLMPGLPGSTAESIKYNMQQLVEILPHYLRLYPLVVIKGTTLVDAYQQGLYQPLSLDAAVAICADYYELAQAQQIKIIKLGLPSNLDPQEILAGPFHPAFGQFVQAELLIRNYLGHHLQNKEIILDKFQQSLLSGHHGKYQAILQERLANCVNAQ